MHNYAGMWPHELTGQEGDRHREDPIDNDAPGRLNAHGRASSARWLETTGDPARVMNFRGPPGFSPVCCPKPAGQQPQAAANGPGAQRPG